ncbi:MAG TPA: AlkA N-terminal domain-containing protein [Polyangiaceae bacterium]|jgi:AraC family transcriptional regulator of adaptative response / DNA-3-methyladenine glycosylase II
MDDDARYRALVARDARFDGIFFVGVTTTGIYCRPVCRARTPGRARCVFFRRAAEAEHAGFRACFRCRPELAPGNATSAVDALSSLARAATARIEAGALNDASLDDLAADLGVTARHLRRAVQSEVGVAPVELAQTARLALAKQLLQDGARSMTDVAHASGFSSVRRFNAVFRARFRRAPSTLVARGAPAPSDDLRISLGHRAPIAWRPLLEFLAPRATAGVESVDLEALAYTRSVRIQDRRGWIRASLDPRRPTLAVDVSASLARHLMPVASSVRALFDLDAQPDAIDAHLARDPLLRPFVRRTPGLRVPGAFDAFELAARAVLGQQVSVRGATTLAGRLARAFGESIETPHPRIDRLFPTPERLARSRPSEIAAIGLPAARAATLHAVAVAVHEGALALDPTIDPATTCAALERIPGIGPWTAQYIAMRALRAPDAFPASDLGLARALGLAPRELTERAAAWSPWRAYAAMHVWRKDTK